MDDISSSPDYTGALLVMVLNAIFGIVAVSVLLQKMQFIGPNAGAVRAVEASILSQLLLVTPIVLIGRWLLKSFVVYWICGGAHPWDFKTAAAITGYSYVPTIVLALLSTTVSWFVMPTIIIDTTDMQLAVVRLEYELSQISPYLTILSVVFSLVGVTWKSYLGGIGVYEGTGGRGSELVGFAVFFVLGFIGFFIDFMLNSPIPSPIG
ncbi:hypothetical protein EU538_11895 [Candidatus Thorarchaeota archaeon]|nr:MAG: hypothetical protein EU538_11895 [Candidatus Thorarchaeota archaeon]